ncbi:hypothetical protein [Sediminispirochaeta bajacaliforniensis]|uniref:hypothetical protein n=1 Tax=Sediminispirochaeta bajacaliforniensis TaxID=148 RepID=UPI00035D5497|nr:hypothetical protein [Sediminispirochaeta bajacaliforniensis]
MSDRYFPAHCKAFPASSSTVMLLNLNDNSVYRASPFESRLFFALRGCRSVEEHIGFLVRSTGERFPVSAVADRFRCWIAAGLLRPEKLLHYPSAAASAKPGEAALTAAVVTARGPETLRPWLESRITSSAFADRKIPFLICDDNQDASASEQNRHLAEALGAVYPGTIRYIGRDERRRFAERLSASADKAGIDRQVVEFLVYGPSERAALSTVGANRNLAMLLAAGDHLLISDDDLSYRCYTSAHAEALFPSFVSDFRPSMNFFPTIEALQEGLVHLADYDLPAVAMRLFSSPQEVGAWSFEALSSSFAAILERGSARIGAISAGYAGARWFSFPCFPALQRFFCNDNYFLEKKDYEAIAENGLNLTLADGMVASDSSFLQGGTLALAADSGAPPFFPLDRHEDQSFAHLFRALERDLLFCHLPVALYHDPSKKLPFGRALLDSDLGLGRMFLLIVDDLGSCLLAESAAGRRGELVRALREIAGLPDSAFRLYLRHLAEAYIDARLRSVDLLLDRYHGEPAWWADDLRAYRESMLREKQEPVAALPPGFADWLGRYAASLDVWPGLQRLAQEISVL